MSGKDKQNGVEWDKLPGTLETSSFRKTSDDYTFTIATPRKHQELVNAILRRMGGLGVFFFVPCGTADEVEALLRENNGSSPTHSLPTQSSDLGTQSFFVPVEVMAEVLGVDPRTVQLDAEKGILVRSARGQYDTLASCATLRKAWKEAENGLNDAYNDERTKAMRLKRQERELDYYERAKKLVNAEAMVRAIEKVKAAEKQQILFMPKQLAPMLKDDAAENEAVLEEWAHSFLKQQTELNIAEAVGKAPTPDIDKPVEMKKRKKKRGK